MAWPGVVLALLAVPLWLGLGLVIGALGLDTLDWPLRIAAMFLFLTLVERVWDRVFHA